jgi:uncharacterized protein
MNTLRQKQNNLQLLLQELGSVVIAFSGSVDSAYLIWCARRTAGVKLTAILADSSVLARNHFQEAAAFLEHHHIPFKVIGTTQPDSRGFLKNELFVRMEEIRKEMNFKHLAWGINVDDQGEFPSTQEAAIEFNVRPPLVEVGLTRADVRMLSQVAGLRIGDKRETTCLSSLIARANPGSREVLTRIEQGNVYLRNLGFTQFRVRDYKGLARIEIASEDLNRLISPAMLQNLTSEFRLLGFKYVTFDCEGYRAGMNETAQAA